MARNRILFDILAFICGIATIMLIVFLIRDSNNFLGLLGVLTGGFVMGFIAYNNDGIKIALFTGLGVFIFGLITGILIITGVLGEMTTAEGLQGIVNAIVGPIIIIIALILILLSGVIGAILAIGAAIGGAIGQNIWDDNKGEEKVTEYQQVSNVCQSCGAKNPPDNTYCKDCGRKLR